MKYWRIVLCLLLVACQSKKLVFEKVPPFIPSQKTDIDDPQILIEDGAIDKALALLRKNLLAGENARDLLLYGKTLRLRGRYDAARETLLPLLRAESAVAQQVNHELGLIALESGNYPEAGNLFVAAQDPLPAAYLEYLSNFPGTAYEILAGETTAVPLVSNPLPQIKAQLERKVSESFVVDTGATFSVIAQSLASEIGLFRTVEGGILLDLDGQMQIADYGIVQSLKIGSLEVTRVPVIIVEDKALHFRLFDSHSVYQCRGVLGVSFLRNFRVTLDFPAQTLRLEPSQAQLVGNKHISLLSTGLNVLLPVACAVEQNFLFQLDTGSNISSLTPQAVTKAGLQSQVKSRIQFIGAAKGWQAALREVQDLSLQIGEYRYHQLNLPLQTIPLQEGIKIQGIIGMDLLLPFRVTLDFVGMTMKLEANEG